MSQIIMSAIPIMTTVTRTALTRMDHSTAHVTVDGAWTLMDTAAMVRKVHIIVCMYIFPNRH